jgi:tryptophanyl-tRNA synthetase
MAEMYKFFGAEQGLRVRDLVDPTKKMSKSDESGKGVIFLSDTPEEVKSKILAATTDSLASVKHDYEAQPGVSNLLDLLKLFVGDPNEFIGQNQYGPLKEKVAGVVADFMQEFQSKLAEVDDKAIMTKLETSEKEMTAQANATLLRVQKAVGLRS